jgi:hypothetical protein
MDGQITVEQLLAKIGLEDPVQIGWVLVDGVFTDPNPPAPETTIEGE